MSFLKQQYQEEIESLNGQISYAAIAASNATEAWERKEYKEVLASCKERKTVLETLIETI